MSLAAGIGIGIGAFIAGVVVGMWLQRAMNALGRIE